MYNYLLDHAVKNVWCNNEQDSQFVIAAHKITPNVGVMNAFKLMNKNVKTPVPKKIYHIYQIGQLNPSLIGLLRRKPSWLQEEWISFTEAMNSLKLFANLYTVQGLELPRYKSYYMFSNDKDLIIAIEEDLRYPVNYASEPVFLRVYTNAYYNSMRSDANVDQIFSYGLSIRNTQDIIDMQVLTASYLNKPGYVYCYRNGLKIPTITIGTISIGDSVEFIYDSSVKRVVTFTISDLHNFSSELDYCYKYLLHYNFPVNDTIEYQDDIDIHVLNEDLGYYYHRNNIKSHRMVTHRDYSVVVDHVVAIADSLNLRTSGGTKDIQGFKLEVKIRKSGYYRPLIMDNSRLFEMYKMSDNKILQSMVGINSVVPEWQAANLEINSYTEMMRSNFNDINIEMIQKAYGYNSMSVLLGLTPSKPDIRSSRPSIDVPYNLYENSTVYEYDQNGLLLGYYYHSIGNEYLGMNAETTLMEVIYGRGTYTPDTLFGTDNLLLPSGNYRVYMSYIVDGVSNGEWKDITGGPLYQVIDGVLKWLNLETDQLLMIRSDNTFLAYDLDLMLVGGNLFFTLSQLEDRGLGFGLDNYVLEVPYGELDVFLNGKSLIRNLDYRLINNKIYILNFKHLTQPADTSSQHLHVRFTGFCTSDLELDAIEDYGFIEHGVLSNNKKHDIRDDKVLRITVGGSMTHRDNLVFSELHEGISIVNPINGTPYQIKDIVVPMKRLTNENTYSLRAKSIELDTRISNYMSLNSPQPTRAPISSIYERYSLVSPFISRIVYDVVNSVILPSTINKILTDNQVLDICKQYEWLLDFDMLDPEHGRDDRYVLLIPHQLNYVIDVNVFQYRFLLKVIDLYCDGLIKINNFISLS